MQGTWLRHVAMAVICSVAGLYGCGSNAKPSPADSLEITPDNVSVGIGATQTFKAQVVKSGETTDVTSSVQWTSTDDSIASVDARGVATGVARGITTIVASLNGVTATATLTVSDASLKAIAVSPSKPSIAAGTTQQFTATGTFSDGTSRDISDETSLMWASSEGDVAIINGRGLASASASGTTNITASWQGVSGAATLTVSDAMLDSLAIEPGTSSLAKGSSSELKLTGVFSDNTTQDLTLEASWSSDDTELAEVSDAQESKGVVTGKKLGTVSVRAAFQDKTASATLVITDAILKSIAITPPDASVPMGAEVTLTATGVFSDDSSQDLSSTVVWTSSDTSIAVVSNAAGSKGKVTAIQTGTVSITAQRNDVSASVELVVTDAQLISLAISAARNNLPIGTELQLTATGTYSDASTRDLTTEVTWLSADSDVLSVNDAEGDKGEARAHSGGSTTITARLGAISSSFSLTATQAVLKALTVSTSSLSVPMGLERAFAALGEYTDGSTHDLTSDVVWSSSLDEVASISNASGSQGRATGLDLGSTQITAARGGITSAAVTLTVNMAALERIEVTPPAATVAKGSSVYFTATGVYSDDSTADLTSEVTWASDSDSIVNISNADGSRGRAAALAEGNASITAAVEGKASAAVTLHVSAATLVSLALTPATPNIAAGTVQPLTATGTYSDDTTQDLTSAVTWSSSDEDVATVSNASGSRGVARGVAAGSSEITAAFAGVVSTPIVLTVSDASLQSITLDPPSASIANGTTQRFTATGHFSDQSTQDISSSVSWSSDNPGVASIVAGLASSMTPGSTSIRASLDGVQSASVSLTVTAEVLVSISVAPSSVSIPLGDGAQFSATGLFSDGSTQDLTSLVTWSTTGGEASISNTAPTKGRATGLSVGSTQVQAVYAGITSNQAALTISNAVLVSISVTPGSATRSKGLAQRFVATGTYSDGTHLPITTSVTWTSSDVAVASISNGGSDRGEATALEVGATTITARDPETEITGTASLQVTQAVVDHIAISPDAKQIAVGTKQQFTATAVLTDGTNQDLTSSATWSSSDSAVVSISNASGAYGLATGLTPGMVEIRARYGAVTGSTAFTISNATLTTIEVETTTPSVAKGLRAELTATGRFSDLTVQDLTTQVSWSSDNPSVATVSNAVGSEGVASTHAIGTVQISASFLGQNGSRSLTVTDKKVSAIQLTELSNASSKPKGTTAHYSATATFTDGTQENITGDVDWISSDTDVVADCDPPLSPAHCFEALDVGSVSITARIMGVSSFVTASRTLAVTAAELVSIAVTPPTPSLPKGLHQQMTATGTYTDNSTQNVTEQVTWSTSDPAIAQFDVDPKGQVTARAVGGPVTLTASVGDVSGSASLSVTNAELQTIGITPAELALAKGLHQQYTATGVYSDGSTVDHTAEVTWDTSNHAVATVSSASGSAGWATAVDVGTVSVNAYLGMKTGSTSLEVTNAVLQQIQVTSPHSSIAKGTTEQLTATGLYSDGSNQDLTTQVSWSSSDLSIASIGLNSGLLQSLQVGPTIVTASLGAVSGTKNLSVTAAELETIQVGRSTDASIPKGTTSQLTATGVYTDGSNQNITENVTWSSSASGTVSISNVADERGLATAVAVGGPVTITATSGAISGTSSLTVTPAVPTALSISPLTPTIANGTTRQFAASASYSDGSTASVTASSAWTSSNAGVALVSNAGGSKGLATSVSTGTTTITASFGGFSASTLLTVTNATLLSISVTPGTPSSPIGFTQRFTARGNYTDASTQDLTNSVTWTSNNENVALVSNEAGSKGLASAFQTGSALIRATLGNVLGQTTFTVTSAILQSIELTPAAATLAACGCQTLVATGHFSDGSEAPITSGVTFLSDDQDIVNVSDTDPSSGVLFRACAAGTPGTTIITATEPNSNVTGSTTATNPGSCP